ncbi:MAG: hypothetical protein IKF93_06880 [Lachnospiraceae bacterium]|nr:hypothetical protein [Lachnospiraceae bacterium]
MDLKEEIKKRLSQYELEMTEAENREDWEEAEMIRREVQGYRLGLSIAINTKLIRRAFSGTMFDALYEDQ